jgi:translation initiation factor 2B subunit (eIF-2B alpha/beta/delta family)
VVTEYSTESSSLKILLGNTIRRISKNVITLSSLPTGNDDEKKHLMNSIKDLYDQQISLAQQISNYEVENN